MRQVGSRVLITGYVSYAHRDEPLVVRFLSLLRPRFESEGVAELATWPDERLPAGLSWRDELADAITTADFCLVCVTPSFLASRYATAVELPALRASGTVLVPVALEPVELGRSELGVLPDEQIFRYVAPGGVRPRSFQECDRSARSRFCDALVAETVTHLQAVDERMVESPPSSKLPRPTSDLPPAWHDGRAIDVPNRVARGTNPGLIEDLIQRMTPEMGVPSEARVRQARRNATARTELLREFGALTSEQIGDEHSRARNRHALAARWRKEGRVLGVPYHGRTVYPGFQFDPTSGELRPAVRAVLSRLPIGRMSEWEVALWWTAANGWLGGRRPVDLLDDDPDGIVAAACRLEPSPL